MGGARSVDQDENLRKKISKQVYCEIVNISNGRTGWWITVKRSFCFGYTRTVYTNWESLVFWDKWCSILMVIDLGTSFSVDVSLFITSNDNNGYQWWWLLLRFRCYDMREIETSLTTRNLLKGFEGFLIYFVMSSLLFISRPSIPTYLHFHE